MLSLAADPIDSEMENHCNGMSFEHAGTAPVNDPTLVIPPTVDPERPPQRNDDNKTFHCGCSCSRGASNEVADQADLSTKQAQVVSQEPNEQILDDASSDYGDQPVNGEEGAESHSIEVGDFGLIPIDVIQRSLARHFRCPCLTGIIPGTYRTTTSP